MYPQMGAGQPVLLILFASVLAVTAQLLMPDVELCGGLCVSPKSVAKDPTTNAVFVCDSGNHRILRFDNPLPSQFASGLATPSSVLGQSNMAGVSPNQGGTVSASGLNQPAGIFVDAQGALWVADKGNNRVLRWDKASARGSGSPADALVGKELFTDGSVPTAPQRETLRGPTSVWVDHNDTLWVADDGHHRVLWYPQASQVTVKAKADGVVGQTGFNTATDFGPPPNFSTTISFVGVSPLGDLFVADTGNNRVLFYRNASGLARFDSPPDFVFLQTDPAAYTGACLSNRGDTPTGVAFHPSGDLLISQSAAQRVTIYTNGQQPTANGMDASAVLGQADLNSCSGPNELLEPMGMSFDGSSGSLWVVSTNNHKVYRYPFSLRGASGSSTVFFKEINPSANFGPSGSNPQDFGIFIIPTVLEEKDENGAVVRGVAFPSQGWEARSSVASESETFGFTINLYDNTTVSMIYSLYAVSAEMNASGISFTTQSGTLKLSIHIDNWPFDSSANTLAFSLALNSTPPITSAAEADIPTAGIQTILVSTASSSFKTIIDILLAAQVDGQPASITTSFTTVGEFQLTFDFPFFSQTLVYDPNFSIVVESDSGDGDDDLLPLLSLLAVLLIPAAMILVTVVVVLAVWLVRRGRNWGGGQGGVVQFDTNIDDEVL